MAAPVELTPESLHDALRAILARGEYPSMAKVREELGTTASQQTLTKHMKKAWQGLADQMGSGLPEGLPRVVVDAAHRFYEEARGYANAELERQKADTPSGPWGDWEPVDINVAVDYLDQTVDFDDDVVGQESCFISR